MFFCLILLLLHNLDGHSEMIIGISRNDQLFSICNNLLKHKQVLILYFINVKKTKTVTPKPIKKMNFFQKVHFRKRVLALFF